MHQQRHLTRVGCRRAVTLEPCKFGNAVDQPLLLKKQAESATKQFATSLYYFGDLQGNFLLGADAASACGLA